MAFSLFKKKKVLDLRKVQEDIILESQNSFSASSIVSGAMGALSSSNVNTPATSTSSNTSGGGGFFGGFFGSDSSSNSSSSPSSSLSSSSEVKTDFWGNTTSPVNSSSNFNSMDPDKIIKVERRIEEISDRFSRILDRVDLLERKMDRAERKGI